MGGEPVQGTVVIQSTGAASSYAFWFFVQREVVFFCCFSPHWLVRAEAKWSLCWFWARNRSLCLFFFFGSLGRCFPEPPLLQCLMAILHILDSAMVGHGIVSLGGFFTMCRVRVSRPHL